MTRKWIETNHLSNEQYSIKKKIRFKTPMLRSNLRDYNKVYIVVSKSVTRKWIETNHLSNEQYSIKKKIRFKTPMLRSNLRDYNKVYIVV